MAVRYGRIRASFFDISAPGTAITYGGAAYLDTIANAEVSKKAQRITRGTARFWKTPNWSEFIQEGRIVSLYQQDQVSIDAGGFNDRELGAFLVQKMKEGVDPQGRSYVDVSGLGVEHLLTKYKHWAPIGEEAIISSLLVDSYSDPIDTTVKTGTGVVNGLKSAILTSVDGVEDGDEIRITMNNGDVWVSKITGVEEEGWLDNQLTFRDRIPVDADAGNAVQVRKARLKIDSGETPVTTTLASGCPSGNYSAVLTSTTSIETGMEIRIELDAGGWHTATLTAVNPVGAASNTVIFDEAMPSGATSGNDVECTRWPLTSIAGFAEGQKVIIALDDLSTFQTIIEDVDPDDGEIDIRDGLPSAASAGNDIDAYDYSTPATDDVTQIMQPALDDGWTLDFDNVAYEGTEDGTSHVPAGESIYDLLQTTADMTGETFRLAYLDVGVAPQLEIKWQRAHNNSFMTLVYSGNTATASATDNYHQGVIHSIAREQESDIVTRLYPIPSDGRIAFSACSAAAITAAEAAGFTITTSTDLYRPDYIEYDAGVSAHGVLEGTERFGSISLTKSSTPAEIEAASDAMLQQAMTRLLEAQERTVWRVTAHMHRPVFPGQYLGIDNVLEPLGNELEGPTYSTLYVMEVREYLAPSGVIMTDLVLSEEPYLLATPLVKMGREMKATQQTARRAAQIYGNVTLRTGLVVTSGGTTTTGTTGTGTSDHGSLTGLLDDDHLQYLRTDGTRTLTGNMSVSSGVTIDGVDLSVHAANASAHHAPVTVTNPISLSGQHVGFKYGLGLWLDGLGNLQLYTPDTLSASSTNSVAAGHSHAITASSDARATAVEVLLKANNSGQLALDNLYAGALPPSGSATLFGQSSDNTRRTLWLKQKSGQTAEMLRIEDSSGDAFLYLTADGSLESGNPGFVSGQTGWQITAGGDVEFNNAFIRGELHAVTFVADEMHATGGTIAVMTAAKVSAPRAAGDNELGALDASFQLVVDASWDTGLSYFAIGDMIRMKPMGEIPSGGSLNLYDIYAEVDSISSLQDRDLANGNPGNFTLACIRRSGGATGFVVPTGTAVVKWGETGGAGGSYTGGMILTSDLSQSPYIDIFTVPADVAGASWPPASTPRVRVGNLDGVLGLAEQWGIAMGTNLSDSSDAARYIVASDLQLKLNNVDLALWNGASKTVDITSSGTVQFGTDVSAAATTTFVHNASTGDVRIGPYDTNKASLLWDQSEGQLILRNYNTPVIVFDDDGSSYFAGPMNIGSSGGIYQGSGTFASPTTGLKIWNDSGTGRLATYASGTVQVYFDTSGKLFAGAGAVRADANGLELQAYTSTGTGYVDLKDHEGSLLFESSGGVQTGYVGARYDTSSGWRGIWMGSTNGSNRVLVQQPGGIQLDAAAVHVGLQDNSGTVYLRGDVVGVGGTADLDFSGETVAASIVTASTYIESNGKIDANTYLKAGTGVTVGSTVQGTPALGEVLMKAVTTHLTAPSGGYTEAQLYVYRSGTTYTLYLQKPGGGRVALGSV